MAMFEANYEVKGCLGFGVYGLGREAYMLGFRV